MENLTTEQVEEINILQDNNQSMISQVSENVMMEKKICVQNKIINTLKDKNECQNQEAEMKKLVDEIKHLEGVNNEKEIQLENIAKENEMIKAKLDRLEAFESENEILQDKLDKKDELEKHFSRKFTCKDCDEKFGSRGDLKHHKRSVHGEGNDMQLLKMKLYKLGKQISDQKLDLSLKISDLKEREETCKCVTSNIHLRNPQVKN